VQIAIRRMATVVAAGLVTVAVASPAQAAPTVQALWHMDAVPDMIDSAGGDNNGTTSNITMSGGFYAFNGTDSIAQVSHEANLNPGPTDIRVEARVNTATPPAAGESNDIIRKGTSGTAGGYYKLEFRGKAGGGMTAACIFKDQNKVVGTAILAVPSTGWSTVTCTKTATSVIVDVNGKAKTTSNAVSAIANSAAVQVGGKGDGTDVLSGLMDYVNISTG
jgi:Concanavalin A-like lectin/glucanases superfamily